MLPADVKCCQVVPVNVVIPVDVVLIVDVKCCQVLLVDMRVVKC